jgi:penicillin amidase
LLGIGAAIQLGFLKMAGKLHYNLSEHPFAAIVDDATRARINVGPIEKNGSPYVPSQSAYRVSDFRQTVGPSVRVVVDVGNWDNSQAINHPGQSGDPESPHYRDLAPMWREGEYFPLLYSRKAVEGAAEMRITLVPAHVGTLCRNSSFVSPHW